MILHIAALWPRYLMTSLNITFCHCVALFQGLEVLLLLITAKYIIIMLADFLVFKLAIADIVSRIF